MRHRWSYEEIEILKDMLNNYYSISDISKRLGRTENAVTLYIKKHGIKRIGHNTVWSKQELGEFVDDWNNGDMSKGELISKYHRSWRAIKQKAYRMGLGRRPASDLYVTQKELAVGMGVSSWKIKNWINNGIKTHRSRTNKTYGDLFDIDEVLLFLEAHQDEFDGRNVDEEFFYVVPDWLRAKIRADREKAEFRRNALWTNAEDQKLQTMFNHGISDTIIANSLGRTESSIRSRRFILGLSRK